MTETKTCSECKSEIVSSATVCAHCTRRVEGITCTSCRSVCKEGATVCKWCNVRLSAVMAERPEFEEFETHAKIVPTILLGGTFLTQSCHFGMDKIVIVTPYTFGLAKRTEEVLWNKVTGFQHHAGVIWDSITIETRGQTTNQIHFLAKEDATQIVQILQQFQS